MFTPKNILVPTDFSKYSDAALKIAVDMAVTYDANIYLIHAIDNIISRKSIDYGISYEEIKQIEENSINASGEKLAKQAAAIIKNGNIKVVQVTKIGDPAEVILKEQKARKVDLIVIASHGKSGIVRYLMGSVATKVAKSAKCPVMLVKI
ncbi:universal stress protein family [hydrocarbon metagenome]|uniref:Universal stress protein family n=1 Tax=hydrocarbon metagenome TaxID=938273 RepID=A0A0W8FQL3_9ZZZZ